MKKIIKVSMLFMVLILLSSCKKEETKTGSAMNELYGYWLGFDTADRRTDIDYSLTYDDVQKDKSLHLNHDIFVDLSKSNLNEKEDDYKSKYYDKDEKKSTNGSKYKAKYKAKYVNNELICLREKYSDTTSYNYLKMIDKDTMINVSYYRSPDGNDFIHPESKYLMATKYIYRKVNKEQYEQLLNGITDKDEFIIEEYNKIRSDALSKKNLKFYKKNFSGWNEILTDKGEEKNSDEFKDLAGKDAKTIMDDYDKNTKNQ